MTAHGSFFIAAPRVFDGTSSFVIDDGAVEVRGSKIVSIGQGHSTLQGVSSDRVIRYPNASILPGMIDAHCHLTLPGDSRSYEEMARDPDEMLALIAVRNMQRHLAAGVTTLRDNGGRNQVTFMVREAINRGYLEGPRLLLSGRPITHRSGHFFWCNGEADGVDDIRAAVRALVAEGADHIKIMASGGATAGNIPYLPSYSTEELRVAVDTAHELGRLTTAHCRARKSIQNALDAGLDCIEHAEFLVPGQMVDYGTGLAPDGVIEYEATLASELVDSGVFVSFTLQAGYDTVVALRSKQTAAELSADESRKLGTLEAHYDAYLALFSRLNSEGLRPRVAISSDAGPFDTQFGRMDLGLELAVRGGMTPTQALESATRIAAQACGVSDVVGTIEPGKDADLLVVDGNPMVSVGDIGNVLAVYKAGGCVVRAEDGQMLAPIHDFPFG